MTDIRHLQVYHKDICSLRPFMAGRKAGEIYSHVVVSKSGD